MLPKTLISIFFSLLYTLFLLIYFIIIFSFDFFILNLISIFKLIYIIDFTNIFHNLTVSYTSCLFKFLIEVDLNFYKKLHTDLDLTVYELNFVNIYEYFLVRFFMKILGAIISTFAVMFYLIFPIKLFYFSKFLLKWLFENSALNTIAIWNSNLIKFKFLLNLNLKQILIYSGISAILAIGLIFCLSNFFYYKEFAQYNFIQTTTILNDNNNYLFYIFSNFVINIYFLTVIFLFILTHSVVGLASIIYDYLKINAFEVFILFFIIFSILIINLLIMFNENFLNFLIDFNLINIVITILVKLNLLLFENTNYGLMLILKW